MRRGTSGCRAAAMIVERRLWPAADPIPTGSPMTRTLRAGALTAAALALMLALAGCVGPTRRRRRRRPTPHRRSPPVDRRRPPSPSIRSRRSSGSSRGLRGSSSAPTTAPSWRPSTTCRSPSDAIATLTTVFGEPPVDEAVRRRQPLSRRHLPSRGTRFVLDERLYDEDRRTAPRDTTALVWPRFAVYFDGPAADGVVALHRRSGLQAGDALVRRRSPIPDSTPTSGPASARPIEAVTTAVAGCEPDRLGTGSP